MDGSVDHIHQITNFKDNKEKGRIQLTLYNSLSINGIVDIKLNGIIIQNDVDISISISKAVHLVSIQMIMKQEIILEISKYMELLVV